MRRSQAVPRTGWLLPLVLLVLTVAVASAQAGTSVVNGTVTDASGAVAPLASVAALNGSTDVSYTRKTTGAGLYAFPALPPSTRNVLRTRESGRVAQLALKLPSGWRSGLRYCFS